MSDEEKSEGGVVVADPVILTGWLRIAKRAGYKSIQHFKDLVESDPRWKRVIRVRGAEQRKRIGSYTRVFAFANEVDEVNKSTPTLEDVEASSRRKSATSRPKRNATTGATS